MGKGIKKQISIILQLIQLFNNNEIKSHVNKNKNTFGIYFGHQLLQELHDNMKNVYKNIIKGVKHKATILTTIIFIILYYSVTNCF